MYAISILLAGLVFLVLAAAFAQKAPLLAIAAGVATIICPWIVMGNILSMDGLSILILFTPYLACFGAGAALIKLGIAGLSGNTDDALQEILDKTKP